MNDAENLTHLLGHLPPAMFRDFMANECDLVIPTCHKKPSRQEQRAAMQTMLSNIDVALRQSIEHIAETIVLLSDELGQQIIHGFSENIVDAHAHALFDTLRNPYERALWLYRKEPTLFDDALDARLADNFRPRVPCYAGFHAPPQLTVTTDAEIKNQFHHRVAEQLGCNKNSIALYYFKRLRPASHTVTLYHIRLYHNGPTDIIERAQACELKSQVMTHAMTSHITYEPATGYLDVSSRDSTVREPLAHLVARLLLQAPRLGATLPLKHYDIQSLAAPRPFELGDEPITSVKVIELGTTHAHRTLRVTIGIHDVDDIYTAAKTIIGPIFDFRQHPLNSATLSIRVKPVGKARARTITVVLRDTHLCNTKTLREHDRALCDRLLLTWNLVKDSHHGMDAPRNGDAA